MVKCGGQIVKCGCQIVKCESQIVKCGYLRRGAYMIEILVWSLYGGLGGISLSFD